MTVAILGKYHAHDTIHCKVMKSEISMLMSAVTVVIGKMKKTYIHTLYSGQEYHTKVSLTCPFHALVFES